MEFLAFSVRLRESVAKRSGRPGMRLRAALHSAVRVPTYSTCTGGARVFQKYIKQLLSPTRPQKHQNQVVSVLSQAELRILHQLSGFAPFCSNVADAREARDRGLRCGHALVW